MLYLREQTGSFAVAGAVSGTLAAGSAIGAPVQGRLVDRHRRAPGAAARSRSSTPSRSARSSASPSSARRRSSCSLCGFVAGFAIPPTSSVLRSMWTDLLEPRLHQAAYALDSTMIELIFITGPLLTAVIAAVTSPAGALIVSAVAVVDRHGDLHRAAADARTSTRATSASTTGCSAR